MGETEWTHAGWVSGIGKWAWIILLLVGIGGIIFGVVTTLPALALWEAGRALWVLINPGIPYTEPMPIFGLIWNIIGGIASIVLALFIIRPKFSKPCGAKDWEALYGWTLKLGANIPWMLIWGIILVIFSWFSWPAVFVLLPTIMLIFAGPRKYNWTSKENKAE